MVTGKLISINEDICEALEIRKKVFQEEQGVAKNLEFDGLDKMAIHAIAYLSLNEKIPVATGRVIYDGNKCKIGRVAVLKEYRRKKFGDFIVRLLVDKAFRSGLDEVICHAQLDSVEFYKTIGFKVNGPEFIEAGIKHLPMKLLKGEMIYNCQNCK